MGREGGGGSFRRRSRSWGDNERKNGQRKSRKRVADEKNKMATSVAVVSCRYWCGYYGIESGNSKRPEEDVSASLLSLPSHVSGVCAPSVLSSLGKNQKPGTCNRQNIHVLHLCKNAVDAVDLLGSVVDNILLYECLLLMINVCPQFAVDGSVANSSPSKRRASTLAFVKRPRQSKPH